MTDRFFQRKLLILEEKRTKNERNSKNQRKNGETHSSDLTPNFWGKTSV